MPTHWSSVEEARHSGQAELPKRTYRSASVQTSTEPRPTTAVSLYPALENRAPISAFASHVKAEVFGDGSVQQLLYPRKLKGCCRKERIEGARLRVKLVEHSIEAARIKQQYTPDPALTVEIVLSWSDANLILTAFAAEPEQHGVYIRAELVNRSTDHRNFALELTLENASGQFREGAGLASPDGDVLLQEVPVLDGTKTSHWVLFTTPYAGLRFNASLKPADKYVFAVAMPQSQADRGTLPSFAAVRQATNTAWKQRFDGKMEISAPDRRMQLSWEANRRQLGVYLQPRPDGLRVLAGLNPNS